MSRPRDHQRKIERKAKKSSKRRPATRRDVGLSPLSPGALRGLDEAEGFLARRQYAQAIETLEELARRYPRRIEVLSLLAHAHRAGGDPWSYQAACERVVAIHPGDADSWLALGAAALDNSQLSVAHQAFAHVAENWPALPDADGARAMQASLREFLLAECARHGLDEKVGLRVLRMHDEINLLLHRGKHDKVCEAAARLLAICPTFTAALNNRSEAHFRSGRCEEAISDSRTALDFDPTNVHARANLTRYLFLSGRFDEAQASAAALAACDAEAPDAYLKKIETFGILGDWPAILSTTREGQRAWSQVGSTPALAEHLAGVAHANLGDLDAARQHWRRVEPNSEVVLWATENLRDSSQPPGERHGPWAFPLENWMPRAVIADLVDAVANSRRESDVPRIVQRHFERCPQLELLVDAVLERSDAAACATLIRLAELAKRPLMLAALKKFALGQRGSDELRTEALLALSRCESIAGDVEVWREGALQKIKLTSQEITYEPLIELPEELNELALLANEALREGRGADAERLFDEALRLRPDSVPTRYNLALSIAVQGRDDEAMEMVRRIHREHPDYLFARTRLAEECIDGGDLEQAKALLAPISQRPKLHTSEYAAWCSANVALALAEGNVKVAQRMLSAWEEVDPDDDRVDMWRERLAKRFGWLPVPGHSLRQGRPD